ncbi:TPA: WD repeat, SAM and U-box domain-containing protein 1 [Trebouxia sp. C0004]
MADKVLPQLQELTTKHVLRMKLAHDSCGTMLESASPLCRSPSSQQEAQEKAQATAKKGKKKKQTPKKLCQETKEHCGSHEVAHTFSSRRAAGKQKLPKATSFPAAAAADVASGSDQEGVNHFLQDLFCCPLTQVTLVEPVIAADDYTYERAAVQRWLRETTPVTGSAAKTVEIGFQLS